MTTSAAASLTCGEIIKHITGFATPATYNAMYTLDFESLTLAASPLPRDPHCAICGDAAQHTAMVATVARPENA
jgi:bacteriocin biosynthesis cyclodehydratase domain-containing protein